MRFAQLIDRARSLSANQIVPFSSEEQLEAERLTTVRFNHLAERAGWGVRLELFVQFAPERFRQRAGSRPILGTRLSTPNAPNSLPGSPSSVHERALIIGSE